MNYLNNTELNSPYMNVPTQNGGGGENVVKNTIILIEFPCLLLKK